MKFVDEQGSIIVPKSVRPIIDYPETVLGNKCGASRQFRLGKLHIREYDNYYSVHTDKISPINDPLGHLIADAPEYLVGILSGISIYSSFKDVLITRSRTSGVNSKSSSVSGGQDLLPPYLAGIFAAYSSYGITKTLKKLAQRRQ
ncbi:MAG: hypothetical protein ACRD8W_25295 [Nitrososphaeraceae archaeon]